MTPHFQYVGAGMRIRAYEAEQHICVRAELHDAEQKARFEKADQRVLRIALLQPEIRNDRRAVRLHDGVREETGPRPHRTAFPVQQGQGDLRNAVEPLQNREIFFQKNHLRINIS